LLDAAANLAIGDGIAKADVHGERAVYECELLSFVCDTVKQLCSLRTGAVRYDPWRPDRAGI
jgi:hypothetical protein